LVDQLAGRGIGWKAYMESAPSSCYKGGSVGQYYKGHNPFVSFKSIVNNPSQCANVVPYTQSRMTTDLNQPSPPSFVWITPNQCNDMHSKCAPTNNVVGQGDTWLKSTIPAVQATTWYRNGGIIILTWDESATRDSSGVPGTNDSGGHIATVVISAGNHGPYPNAGDHFGTLRGLEEAYGVSCLAAACNSAHGDIRGALPA
jgi:phosphatidylinositol-3-phosphatase